MDVLEILVESIAGTSAMTVFSYFASGIFRELFSEPVLINVVLRKTRKAPSPRLSGFTGWILHYSIGFVFTIAFHWLWQTGIVQLGWLPAMALGVVAGLIGISGWRVFFMLPDQKPALSYRAFYQQLLLAHIIFTLVVYASHLLLGDLPFTEI